MDIGFIVAPCSRLGRAGSLSRAGRGSQALQVLARRGFHYPAQAHTPMGARSSAAPGKEGRAGDGERWAMAEGEREREATERELSLGDFQPIWLHSEGPFWELRGCWAGPCGRGCARARASAQVCPGARTGSEGSSSILLASLRAQGKEKPTSLPRYRSTFLIPWDVILPQYKRL